MTTTGGNHIEILQYLGEDQYLCEVTSKHGCYITQIAGKDIVGIEKYREGRNKQTMIDLPINRHHAPHSKHKRVIHPPPNHQGYAAIDCHNRIIGRFHFYETAQNAQGSAMVMPWEQAILRCTEVAGEAVSQ